MANPTTDPQLAIVGDLPDTQYDAMVDIYAKMVIYHLHHTQDEITHSASVSDSPVANDTGLPPLGVTRI